MVASARGKRHHTKSLAIDGTGIELQFVIRKSHPTTRRHLSTVPYNAKNFFSRHRGPVQILNRRIAHHLLDISRYGDMADDLPRLLPGEAFKEII